MKYFVLGLLFLGAVAGGPRLLSSHAQSVPPPIVATDPDFSIVVFPDTQYYYGSNSYVLSDQVNWVVAHRSSLNIKMVVGMGDIVDGGGYPVSSQGRIVGTCAKPLLDANWQSQWQQARAAVDTLNSHGIYYQPTIGNHDYDCEGDRPQPRSTTNYFTHFGNLALSPTGYILDSAGNRTPNFYKIMQIGSTQYMVLSLELFPRSWVIAAANTLISNFKGPVVLATHAYLSNDGSGPTFGSSFAAGSAYPLCSGFPANVYGCRTDSLASYKPVGGGTDGIGLWYQLVSKHPNILMTLSGHIRNPNPGDFPFVPNYNGVGHVNCAVQSWTTLCSTPYRPIQILSDFQGQGNNGYFGYGYLRILTVSPARKTVSVFTYSPSVANTPGKFPSGLPAYKTDAYDQYSLNFPNTFGGPDKEVTHIVSPIDGSHVSQIFPISATTHGPGKVSHIQVYVNGVKQSEYANVSSLPAGASVMLPGPGTHRVAVQAYDNTTARWVKSVIYVTSP